MNHLIDRFLDCGAGAAAAIATIGISSLIPVMATAILPASTMVAMGVAIGSIAGGVVRYSCGMFEPYLIVYVNNED